MFFFLVGWVFIFFVVFVGLGWGVKCDRRILGRFSIEEEDEKGK